VADDKTKWGLIGLGAVVLIAIVGVVVFTHDEAACPLTARAVELIASGARHGSDAQEILNQAAEFAPEACQIFVTTVVNRPEEQVSFVLKLPDGETEQTVTGAAIISPPPPVPPGSLERVIQCG
jgi:hypothetical protein